MEYESCSICIKGSRRNEKIYSCFKCAVRVHKHCYGENESMDSETYLCDFCLYEGSDSNRKCELCPCIEGPLTKTTTEKYVHTICSFYIPEVTYEDKIKIKGVNIAKIDKKRFQLRCSICKKKKGATIKCNYYRCQKYLHVTCGKAKNSLCELIQDDVINFVGYCTSHAVS